MDENEFEFEGVTYVAAKGVYTYGCEGCNLFDDGCLIAIGEYPCCSSRGRLDGRDVIFVVKQ